MNPILILPTSMLTVIILTAFGRRVLKLFRVQFDTPLDKSIFGFALGTGTLAYAILFIGLMGWLNPPGLIFLLALAAIISIGEFEALAVEAGSALSRKPIGKPNVLGVLVAICIGLLGLMALIRSLAPPNGQDWDGLAYHLAVPKMYLANQAIRYIPFISHSNFPFTIEMLYTLGLALGSSSLAKLFHFWMYVGTALTVYIMCRRYFQGLETFAVLLFSSVPVVFWEAGLAYADISTALYLTLAVYSLIIWRKTGKPSILILSGVMGGFALGTKVFALVPLGALALCILFDRTQDSRVSAGVKFLTPVIIIGSPWYIKSWVFTGNPVYPFLYSVFGGKNWSQEAAAAYRQAQMQFGVGHGVRDFLFLPWDLLVNGNKFFDWPTPLGHIGPAFLGLIPLHVLAGRRCTEITIIGFVAGVFIVGWFFMMQQSRYLIGVLPLLCIIAASGGEAVCQWRIAKPAVAGLICICVLGTLVMGSMLACGCLRVAIGIEPPNEYLSRTFESFDAQTYINKSLPEEAKIVLFDEVRGFYLDRKYIWGNPGHHEIIPWVRIKTPREMVEWFVRNGYTYALVNHRLASDDSLHKHLIPGAIENGLMRPIFSSQGVSVYAFDMQASYAETNLQ